MLEETIERLRTIALDADDATGHFAAMYARVTDRVRVAIDDGRFGDGGRMARFALAFADWYLGPLDGSRPQPRCWAAAADGADDDRLLIVQHLLLGINAHVNHDLPQVVVELTRDGERLADLRPDFDAINDLLADTQPDVLRDLGRVSGWTQVVAASGGGRVFDFSLERARDQAWRTAVAMESLGPTEAAARARDLDDLVAVLAHVVANRRPPVSWLLAVPRWLEDDDPTVVTRRLLGPLA